MPCKRVWGGEGESRRGEEERRGRGGAQARARRRGAPAAADRRRGGGGCCSAAPTGFEVVLDRLENLSRPGKPERVCAAFVPAEPPFRVGMGLAPGVSRGEREPSWAQVERLLHRDEDILLLIQAVRLPPLRILGQSFFLLLFFFTLATTLQSPTNRLRDDHCVRPVALESVVPGQRASPGNL